MKRKPYVSRAFDFHIRNERRIKKAIEKDLNEKERGVKNDNNGRTCSETTKS